MELKELASLLKKNNGFEVYMVAGQYPQIHYCERLQRVAEIVVTKEQLNSLFLSSLTTSQMKYLQQQGHLCACFEYPYGRFRISFIFQKDLLCCSLRLISNTFYSFEELILPKGVCKRICSLPKGIIIIAGRSCSGKSTTAATLINYINENYNKQILTIEDPVEFIHLPKKCSIWQCEVKKDVHSFYQAVESSFIKAADVLYISQVPDYKTMDLLLQIAKSHLVLLHLPGMDTVDVIQNISLMFPIDQYQRVLSDLAATLQAVFVQQLIPSVKQLPVLALETLVITPAHRSLIRDDKIYQIFTLIAVGQKYGFRMMNQSLFELVQKRIISEDTALIYSSDQEDLARMFQRYGR